MSQRKPLLIITMGPTGSGKSSLASAAANELGIRDFHNAKAFLIDDYVEADIRYKQRVHEIIDSAGIRFIIQARHC